MYSLLASNPLVVVFLILGLGILLGKLRVLGVPLGSVTGVLLVEELLYYGISAISLETTGSSRTEGIRACVSLTGKKHFGELEQRLRRFDADQQQGFRAIDEY